MAGLTEEELARIDRLIKEYWAEVHARHQADGTPWHQDCLKCMLGGRP
jgi:hypothetical protein